MSRVPDPMSTRVSTPISSDAAETSSTEPLSLDLVRIDPTWALRIPATLALRKRVLPLSAGDERVRVACADPEDRGTLQLLERYLERPIEAIAAEPDSLRRALTRIYGGVSIPGAGDPNPIRFRGRDSRQAFDAEDAVAVCDELLQAAALRQASDIHLVPTERQLIVRFRVDGILETYRELPLEATGGVISRFKVLAELDIAEKRAPQDGRFTARIGPAQLKVDIRTATLPTRHGERMTLRLLASQDAPIDLESLGMSAIDRERFERAIARPHGLVLLTGPTGSGKSTTLYAAIRRLLQVRGGNVVTIEDPIEYAIPGTSQVEVDSVDKVNFGKALRSVLRHDPDVVMIGEIRDSDTADVAMKAALTGHLVLSTLHTNNTAGVVTRLIDMGMERFMVAATLRLAVAQRLVRRLCPHCHCPRPMTAEEAFALGRPDLEGATVHEPVGCVYCAGRGYAGRVAGFEMLSIDESTARAIADGADEGALVAKMRRDGAPLLMDDAIAKILEGTTTVRDVLGAVTIW